MRLVLGALAACSIPSTDMPGEQVLRGEHVVVHADPQLPICQPALDDADAYLAATATFLGAALPDVTYVVHDRSDDSCGFGSAYIADCTVGHTIFAYNWISYRELANAVVWDWGHPPALFSEGLGGALSGPPVKPVDRAAADVASIAATTSFFSGTPDQVTSHFDIANDFVTFLLAHDGVAKLRAITQQLVYLSDPLTIDQTFDHVYGETLADAISAWRAEAPLAGALPLDTLACTAPAIAADATGKFSASDPACPNGKTAAGGALEQPVRHVIDLPAPGLYELGTSSGLLALSDVRSCSAAEQIPPADYIGMESATDYNESRLLVLDAGPHALELAPFAYPVEGVDLGTMSWSMSALGAQSAACATAPTLTISSRDRVVFESSPARWPLSGGIAETWLRVDPGSSPGIAVDCFLTATSCSPGFARLCTGTCGAMTCQDLAPDASWMPSLGSTFWIDMRATPDLADVVYLDLHGS